MTVTVMKTTFEILKPKIIYIRNWNDFSNKKFRAQLLTKLSLENFNNSSNGINKFLKICVKTPDIFAPQEKLHAMKQYDIHEQSPTKCSKKAELFKKQVS